MHEAEVWKYVFFWKPWVYRAALNSAISQWLYNKNNLTLVVWNWKQNDKKKVWRKVQRDSNYVQHGVTIFLLLFVYTVYTSPTPEKIL